MILFEKKYQTFDPVFHHQMKHLEVRQKYSAARRIFNSLLGTKQMKVVSVRILFLPQRIFLVIFPDLFTCSLNSRVP